MPKKKVTKKITIKEITDAFYNGAPLEEIKKMAELLVQQNTVTVNGWHGVLLSVKC